MKKSFVKKKKFAEMCRRQVVEKGMINQANGQWAAASTSTRDQHMLAGYRAGRR